MIVIDVIFQALAGKRAEFISLMQQTANASRREMGCILYRFASDVDNEDRFVLTEIWETEDALKAHFGADAFKTFFKELPGKGSFIGDRAWHGPLASYILPNPRASR